MSTYTPIASQTLSSAAASVTFSGIPQTYTDLVVIISAIKSGSNSSGIGWQANGDTGSNYSVTSMYGFSGGAGSDRGSNATFASVGRVGTSQSTSILNFQNYSNTTTNKTCLARGNTLGGQDITIANVALWRNTAAITSLVFTLADASNFNSGSTFTLYGITAA